MSQENFSISVNSHIVHWQLVKEGAGLGLMTDQIGDQEPMVEKVLPGHFPQMKVDNWLVCHRDLRNSRRIRVVFDFLFHELEQRL